MQKKFGLLLAVVIAAIALSLAMHAATGAKQDGNEIGRAHV